MKTQFVNGSISPNVIAECMIFPIDKKVKRVSLTLLLSKKGQAINTFVNDNVQLETLLYFMEEVNSLFSLAQSVTFIKTLANWIFLEEKQCLGVIKDLCYRFEKCDSHCDGMFFCRIYQPPSQQNTLSEYSASKNSIPAPFKHHVDCFRSKVKNATISPGYYRIGLSQRAASFFFHELLGHAFEYAEQVQSTKKLNIIFPEELQVIDNPLIPLWYGSYQMDQFCEEATEMTLMQHGVLLGSLDGQYNEVVSKKRKKGRAENLYLNPSPRLSNLIIDFDTKYEKIELVNHLQTGLIIDDFYEGQEAKKVDGEIKLKAYYAHEVIDGYRSKKIYPLVELTISLSRFSKNFISSHGEIQTRPIDCYKKESGWIRTTASSPAIIIHAFLKQKNYKLLF
ncbi:MAG: metallopeptidase TldD-related protein [Desulfococcaceae bacterium]